MRSLSLVGLRSKPVTEGQEKGEEGPGAEADGREWKKCSGEVREFVT